MILSLPGKLSPAGPILCRPPTATRLGPTPISAPALSWLVRARSAPAIPIPARPPILQPAFIGCGWLPDGTVSSSTVVPSEAGRAAIQRFAERQRILDQEPNMLAPRVKVNFSGRGEQGVLVKNHE